MRLGILYVESNWEFYMVDFRRLTFGLEVSVSDVDLRVKKSEIALEPTLSFFNLQNGRGKSIQEGQSKGKGNQACESHN
jgi:hypothetical protein